MPSNATSPAATILLAIAVTVIGYVVVLTWLWPTDLEAEAKRRIAREGAPPPQVASAPAISVSPPARPAPTLPSAAPVPPPVVAAPTAPTAVVTPTRVPSPPIATQPAPVNTPPRPPSGQIAQVDPVVDDPNAAQLSMPAAGEPAPPSAPRSETGRPAAPVIAAELRNAATESLLAQVRTDPFEFARLYHVDLDAAQAIADGRAPMPEEIIRSRAGL